MFRLIILLMLPLSVSALSIGTISYSKHYDSREYNESHNGFYVKHNNIVAGRFKNSAGNDSTSLAYERPIDSRYSLMAGLASNYPKTMHQINGYAPIVGGVIKISYFKILITPLNSSIGLEYKFK